MAATAFVQDLRLGVRLLRRQKFFAITAILLTALGVGAATTFASVAYHVLFKPLPWPDAQALVKLTETREGSTRLLPPLMINSTFLAWRDGANTLDGLAAYDGGTVTLTGFGEAERMRRVEASAALFSVLKSPPLLGTPFSADDERPGRNHVAVISYGLWQRRFGGRPDVLGRELELDGEKHRIVGVMPQEFFFPDRRTEVWTPMFVAPVAENGKEPQSVSFFEAIGRLRPGVTPVQAAAEGTSRARGATPLGMVGVAIFGSAGPAQISAARYLDALTAEVRPALLVLVAAVALLLLTAISSIAGMQLARALTRRREMAIRSALGAAGGRLARQLLTENAVVGVLGGLAGLLLSAWLHRLLPRLLPADFPRTSEVVVDWRVAAFALIASVAVGLACGLLPALIARRLNLVETLVDDSIAPIGGGLRSHVGRTRAVIMAGQVAIAALLLVGAALLGRSMFALTRVDRGFEPRRLLTAALPMPTRSFTGVQRAALADSILEQVARLPGVQRAATSNVMPLVPRESLTAFTMPPAAGTTGEPVSVQAASRIVSPGYFDALGLPVVEGRGFTDADSRASQPVVVVNRAFVRTYLRGSGVGTEMPMDLEDGKPNWQIVGVVDDIRQRGATDVPHPEIYVTYRQLTAGIEEESPLIVVRTSGDPAAFIGTLRGLVRSQNASLALESVLTMEERMQVDLARPRLYMILFSSLAGFALLIAGVGLFGVLSYSVAQRSREIGVRTALGARPVDIVRLVVRQGAFVMLAGIGVGLAGAFALVNYLGSLLYGVTARDPISFVVVSIALVVVAVIACYVPARRAAKIDPLRALRSN